jgi:hypothetical protein
VIRHQAATLAIVLLTACRAHPSKPATARAYGQLRTVSDALLAYRGTCGVYPATLDALGQKPGVTLETRTCESLMVLDRSAVDVGSKGADAPPAGGYVLLYTPSEPVGGGFRRYALATRWAGPGRHDVRRSFWVGDEGKVRWADDRAAGPLDQEVEGIERPERVLHPRPFFEHPARFPTVVAALEEAIVRLRQLRPVPWLTLSAQGRRGDGGTGRTSLRIREDVIDPGRPLDADRIRARAAVPAAAFVTLDEGFSVAAATPREVARILDAIFHELGVRAHEDEDGYAVGGEFLS